MPFKKNLNELFIQCKIKIFTETLKRRRWNQTRNLHEKIIDDTGKLVKFHEISVTKKSLQTI